MFRHVIKWGRFEGLSQHQDPKGLCVCVNQEKGLRVNVSSQQTDSGPEGDAARWDTLQWMVMPEVMGQGPGV